MKRTVTAEPAAADRKVTNWLDAEGAPAVFPGEVLAKFVGGPADGRSSAIVAKGIQPPTRIEILHYKPMRRDNSRDIYILNANRVTVTYVYESTVTT